MRASAVRGALTLRRRCLPLLLLLPALLGCGEEAALAVGDVSFPEEHLAGLGEAQVERLVLITAVGRAAAEGELERLGAPVLARRLAEARILQLRMETALEAAGVDDAALRDRYEASPEPELLVRHLVVLSERWAPDHAREAARRQAEAALERIRSGEPFPDVAGEVSEEPGARERGGLLQPGREGTWVPEFWEAARALEEGEVSGVVETEYGFHVLRLDERRRVPFDEARPRVAAEVASGLDDPEAWEERVEAWTRELSLDTDAVEAFRMDPGETEASPLATWEGGTLEPEDLRRHLRGLAAPRVEAVLEGAPEARRAEVRRAARDRILLEEADRMGIELPEPDRAEIFREWDGTALRWAAAFGFREGMSPAEVRDRALVALGASEQSARIAREEVLEWSPALRSAYPVEAAER